MQELGLWVRLLMLTEHVKAILLSSCLDADILVPERDSVGAVANHVHIYCLLPDPRHFERALFAVLV